MVRRRVEIRLIEDKARRHTTFTKRRQGLVKKTEDLTTKFDAEAAVITFSKAGNVFAFGHPSVESVVKRYLSEPPEEAAEGSGGVVVVVEGIPRGGGGIGEEEKGPAAALTVDEAGSRICQALEKGSWDVAVEGLGPREIDELAAGIVEIRRVVAARVEKIAARAVVVVEARAVETAARAEENNSPEGGVSGGGSTGESGVGGIDGKS